MATLLTYSHFFHWSQKTDNSRFLLLIELEVSPSDYKKNFDDDEWMNEKILMVNKHVSNRLLYTPWLGILFCSDLAHCCWGHHRDYTDISEVEAEHRNCATEGGKQVSMGKTSVHWIWLCLTLFIFLMRTMIALVSRAISYIMSTLFYPLLLSLLLIS